MSGQVDSGIIARIREANDIVQVVGRYVNLKKAGSSFKGLCPFHSEKTPSFTVSPDKQLFYCFGCATGGDVISFIMRIENLEFPEAVKFLAERAGIDIPQRTAGQPVVSQNSEFKEALTIMEFAAKYYHYVLMKPDSGQKARKYLADRKLDRETITGFGIGYAPDTWDSLAKLLAKRRFSLKLAARLGLVSESKGAGKFFDHGSERHSCTLPQSRFSGKNVEAVADGDVQSLSEDSVPPRIMR